MTDRIAKMRDLAGRGFTQKAAAIELGLKPGHVATAAAYYNIKFGTSFDGFGSATAARTNKVLKKFHAKHGFFKDIGDGQ